MSQGYIPLDRPGDLVAITPRVTPEQRQSLDDVAAQYKVDRVIVLRALLQMVADGHASVHKALAKRLGALVKARDEAE